MRKGRQLAFDIDISRHDDAAAYLQKLPKGPLTRNVFTSMIDSQIIAELQRTPERPTIRCRLVENADALDAQGLRYAGVAEFLAFASQYPDLAEHFLIETRCYFPAVDTSEYSLRIERCLIDLFRMFPAGKPLRSKHWILTVEKD
jgi:hypothetical protein